MYVGRLGARWVDDQRQGFGSDVGKNGTGSVRMEIQTKDLDPAVG